MFVLVEMVDTVRIPPWQFKRKLNDSIAEELNKKLANKVLGPRGRGLALGREGPALPTRMLQDWPWASSLSQNSVSSPVLGNSYSTGMLEGIKRETGFEKGPCNYEVLGSTLPNYFAILGKSLTPSGPVPTCKMQIIVTVHHTWFL